jgi:hypothetical protein
MYVYKIHIEATLSVLPDLYSYGMCTCSLFEACVKRPHSDSEACEDLRCGPWSRNGQGRCAATWRLDLDTCTGMMTTRNHKFRCRNWKRRCYSRIVYLLLFFCSNISICPVAATSLLYCCSNISILLQRGILINRTIHTRVFVFFN